MLGLQRGTVQLEMHNPEWDINGAATAAMLKEVLGTAAVDVQHIGSTSMWWNMVPKHGAIT